MDKHYNNLTFQVPTNASSVLTRPNYTTWSAEQTHLAEVLQKIYIAIISIISISIIVTNILVLIAMYKYSPLRTVTNRFVVSLSLADLIAGSCFIIALGITTDADLLTNTTICAARAVLPQTALQVSLFNLLGIAVDRYIAVMYPLHYSSVMVGKLANRLIVGMWLYAIGLVVIPMIFTHNPIIKEGCYVEFFLNKYHLLVVFLHYWLGALTMIFIYSCIFRTTTAHIKRLEKQSSVFVDQPTSSKNRRSNSINSNPHISQTVKVFSLVFGTFFICLTPYYSMYMMMAFTSSPDSVDFELSFIWLPLTDVLIALNSTINPYIYAWKYTDFRIAFKNLLCCRSQYQYNLDRSSSMYEFQGRKPTRASITRSSPLNDSPVTMVIDPPATNMELLQPPMPVSGNGYKHYNQQHLNKDVESTLLNSTSDSQWRSAPKNENGDSYHFINSDKQKHLPIEP